MSDKIKYWLDLCDYDLLTAEAMLNSKRFLYVGFMCHQVVEKSLKAVYVKKFNETPPYIHNLITLAKKTDLLDLFDDIQNDLVDELGPLNIEARYPTYKEDLLKTIDEIFATNLLENTKEFYSWIKSKL